MASIFIFLAAALGAAAAVFHTAHGQLYYGTPWATRVCGVSQMLCNNPDYLAYAAGGCLIVGLGFALGRALS
ncbi:hypothetical protein LPW26_06765 [Rhodopseudomonas sp. HC1]|uniref:hypothetical protein n=1 Tax=Rhodopseudomonas infernalis TaxID=2897386 RepID=UPI001EE8B844|nr:hypothetical protein [Rhodopseudomonas infernalis]MCG6204329.1 hypothetical protein [Rhodopseudomonas infernalis]